MSIIYNDTEIENIIYDNTNVDSVFFLNTEVFSSTPKTLSLWFTHAANKSMIVDGITYTSNTSLSIKPGTTVSMNCTINNPYTGARGVKYNCKFSYWWYSNTNDGSSMTYNGNQSFSFVMPNYDITIAFTVQEVNLPYNWPSSGNISESTFLDGLNINASNRYDTSLVGRTVALKESNTTHNWIIVRVNTNSYDLWYNGSIGKARWKGENEYRYWTNNSSSDTSLVRGLCNSYKSKLSSSIQAKLKTGLNANCGSDTVVIFSSRQLGNTSPYILEASDSTSNTAIPYFDSKERRDISGVYYATSSAYSRYSYSQWYVSNGNFSGVSYDNNNYVVPAIRVG